VVGRVSAPVSRLSNQIQTTIAGVARGVRPAKNSRSSRSKGQSKHSVTQIKGSQQGAGARRLREMLGSGAEGRLRPSDIGVRTDGERRSRELSVGREGSGTRPYVAPQSRPLPSQRTIWRGAVVGEHGQAQMLRARWLSSPRRSQGYNVIFR
jgi:hypothetical protein